MVFNPEPQTRQQSIFKQRKNDTLHTRETALSVCVIYGVCFLHTEEI